VSDRRKGAQPLVGEDVAHRTCVDLRAGYHGTREIGAVETGERRQDTPRGVAGAVGNRRKSLGGQLAILNIENSADQDHLARERFAQKVDASSIDTGDEIGTTARRIKVENIGAIIRPKPMDAFDPSQLCLISDLVNFKPRY
jgi:hypothetical protein